MGDQESIIGFLLFNFRKGKNAVQAWKKLCEDYSGDCHTEHRCQRWLAHFRLRNFSVRYAAHTGPAITTDGDKVKALIETSRSTTTREVAEKLDISNSTLHLHLQQLGFVHKLDV